MTVDAVRFVATNDYATGKEVLIIREDNNGTPYVQWFYDNDVDSLIIKAAFAPAVPNYEIYDVFAFVRGWEEEFEVLYDVGGLLWTEYGITV